MFFFLRVAVDGLEKIRLDCLKNKNFSNTIAKPQKRPVIICSKLRMNDQLSDRSNFAVDRFYDSVHCTSIAKMAFSWVPDWSFFKLVTAKRPLELPFRLVISGRFAFNELKNDRSKIEKNVGLAIALGWAMSLKGLTANLDRSFEWFISPRKRPIVRAVAQLTREIFTILTLRT